MNLYDDLYSILAEIEDPLTDLERIGITDHGSLRRFHQKYGSNIAHGIQQEHPITHETLTRSEHIRKHLRERTRPSHCKHGHEYTEENTYYYFKRGQRCRQCRACARNYQRRHRSKL